VGVLKLSCDASFLQESRSGSWGFLIRDHDGGVVMAGRGKINNVLSAFHAELIACLQGIQVANNMGIGNLILETDAINVQQALLSRGYDVRPEGALIEELKAMAMLNFSTLECKFLGCPCFGGFGLMIASKERRSFLAPFQVMSL
jgi:ribonuclease HI